MVAQRRKRRSRRRGALSDAPFAGEKYVPGQESGARDLEASHKRAPKGGKSKNERVMGALGAAVLLIILASVGLFASSRALAETAHDQDDMCPLNKKGTRAAMVLLAGSGFLLMFAFHSLLPYDWSNSVWTKGKDKAKEKWGGALMYKPMGYLIIFGIVFLTFGMLLDKNIEEDQCNAEDDTLDNAQTRIKHYLVVPGGVAIGAGFFILGLSAFHNRKKSSEK